MTIQINSIANHCHYWFCVEGRIPKDEQKNFINLTDKILLAKRDPASDTREIERDINRLVYRLYDLTPDEIAIVEGKSS